MTEERSVPIILEGKSRAKVTRIEAPDKLAIPLVEFKCGGCKRVLCLYAIIDGCVVVKCKRCRAWNALDIHSEVSDNEHTKVE